MRARPIEPGFHVADAQEIALAYDGESLVLSFVDWREEQVGVAFDEAVAFRWQRAEEVQPGEAWDGTSVHPDSPWLEEHRRQPQPAIRISR
jgi:hypothetical protein